VVVVVVSQTPVLADMPHLDVALATPPLLIRMLFGLAVVAVAKDLDQVRQDQVQVSQATAHQAQ
jgi:hypothetical protein